MINKEMIKLAMQALGAHKLRSFLTLLGVIIGVASVIAVVSVIQGLNQYMTDQILQFGTTTFSVNKISSGFQSLDEALKQNKRPNITLDDMDAVERDCVHCQYLGGIYSTGATLVKYKNNEIEGVTLRGVTVNEAYIGEVMELSAGRHLTNSDIDHVRNVTILGGDTAERLFANEDPIGKEINVDGSMYSVIGVATKKGDSLFGGSQDAFVRIPITIFKNKYNLAQRSLNIDVQAATTDDLDVS